MKMSIKKLTITLFIVVFSISYSSAQNFDLRTIDMITFEMAEHNIFETEEIGFAASKSKQFQNYLQLQEKATDEQLLDLAAHHYNAVVRLYSLQAINTRKINIPNELAEKFKKDKTSVTIQQGCIRSIKSFSYLASINLIDKKSISDLRMERIKNLQSQ